MVRRIAFSVLTLALLSGHSINGQPGTSSIRVYFSVLDKQEKPVLGLTAGEFDLRIEGRSAALDAFRPGLPHSDRSIPLVLWILIDFNPNINATMTKQQADAAARAFSLFHPDSAIGVKLVSDRSETLEPLSHDPMGLRRAFADFSRRREVLSYGTRDDTAVVGPAGILRAADYAIDELVNFSLTSPPLKGREVHRAIMIISDGNINPNFSRKPLYEKAGSDDVFQSERSRRVYCAAHTCQNS